MYQFNSRVRYSEIGENGRLTLTGIINYLQDCSTFQSEDCKVGIRYLEEKKKAWMLSAWRIFINRYPKLGEEITVGTWHCGNKGIYGFRNFVMEDQFGNRLVEADSRWFLLNLENRLPCRVTEEDVAAYGLPGSPIPMAPVPGKILLPEEYEEGSPIAVDAHHIDTNHHVNNAQYVEFAREAAHSCRPICQLRVEYKKAAAAGDLVYPRIGREDGAVTVALLNSQGEPYAVVWMKEEPGKEKND